MSCKAQEVERIYLQWIIQEGEEYVDESCVFRNFQLDLLNVFQAFAKYRRGLRQDEPVDAINPFLNGGYGRRKH